MDKHPESRKRGITLDLGFSAFSLAGKDVAPPAILAAGFDAVQFTLVDCPGHASLIKTIIGGASIIDMMLLVMDITKGIQTQTAECLVLADILPNTSQLIVVLNKLDCVPPERRATRVKRLRARIADVLSGTRFAGAPVVATAASIGGRKSVGEAAATSAGKSGIELGRALASAKISRAAAAAGNTTADHEDVSDHSSLGVENLISVISEHVQVPRRDGTGPLYFSVDHCFPIKGQGTVLTGTVLSGSVSVNDEVELPELQVTRKVKSMQMFRKPVSRAVQGDRIGLCVKNLDAKLVERGIIASPGSLLRATAVLALVRKVKYYGDPIATKAKFHISIGHATTMCTAHFFGSEQCAETDATALADCGDGQRLSGGVGGGGESPPDARQSPDGRRPPPRTAFDFGREYIHDDFLRASARNCVQSGAAAKAGAPDSGDAKECGRRNVCDQWALLSFEAPITCQNSGAVIIGSRLDSEKCNACRLAFHGVLVEPVDKDSLATLKIFKRKTRTAIVDKICDKVGGGNDKVGMVIAKGLFGKQSDLSKFIGKAVTTANGDMGTIDGAFGKSGKFKVVFNPPAVVRVRDKLFLKFRTYARVVV